MDLKQRQGYEGMSFKKRLTGLLCATVIGTQGKALSNHATWLYFQAEYCPTYNLFGSFHLKTGIQ